MPFCTFPRSGRLPAAFSLHFVVAGLICTALASASALAAETWSTYRNPRFGYTFSYPSSTFAPDKTSDDGGGQVFLTSDGRAKLVVNGALNDERFTPSKYRQTILEEFAGYDRMDYSPRGKTWFVLSGFRGEAIYYQKVMFSCGNNVINVLSVTFPRAEKKFFEPLIEVMEDNFKPGRGEGCR